MRQERVENECCQGFEPLVDLPLSGRFPFLANDLGGLFHHLLHPLDGAVNREGPSQIDDMDVPFAFGGDDPGDITSPEPPAAAVLWLEVEHINLSDLHEDSILCQRLADLTDFARGV